MTPTEELSGYLTGTSRVIVIARSDVDLKAPSGGNDLVLLVMAESSLAAGGRGGGFGERRVVKVVHFRCSEGTWEKLFETREEDAVAAFEIPYNVSRIPITLGDGTDAMGYGVVEQELVEQMIEKTRTRSPA
jgi:hypothetical protein